MKQQLCTKLAKEYPWLLNTIFTNNKIPLKHFYLGIGDGWYPLLVYICKVIAEEIKKHPEMDTEDYPFIVTDIKEKWGGLRFYISHGSDVIYDAICVAEKQSVKKCEVCGASGTTKSHRGWYLTRCWWHHLLLKLHFRMRDLKYKILKIFKRR